MRLVVLLAEAPAQEHCSEDVVRGKELEPPAAALGRVGQSGVQHGRPLLCPSRTAAGRPHTQRYYTLWASFPDMYNQLIMPYNHVITILD